MPQGETSLSEQGTDRGSHGIFREVNQEVGQIIVADVNHPRIAELLAPDRVALWRLSRKQG
jgi:isocitrate lyase